MGMHVHCVRIQVHAYICMIVPAGICVYMYTFILQYVYECMHICLNGHHVCMPIRTTHNARTCTIMPNKSVALSASACQVSLH